MLPRSGGWGGNSVRPQADNKFSGESRGLQFFLQHTLKFDWRWLEIIKVPQVRTLPDILTVAEIERLIGATRHLCYRVFLLATCSMGLRLSETLALQVGDIDSQRKQSSA